MEEEKIYELNPVPVSAPPTPHSDLSQYVAAGVAVDAPSKPDADKPTKKPKAKRRKTTPKSTPLTEVKSMLFAQQQQIVRLQDAINNLRTPLPPSKPLQLNPPDAPDERLMISRTGELPVHAPSGARNLPTAARVVSFNMRESQHPSALQ